MTETDKIEAEINRSRHALNDTINQLGGKLSPGQMVDEALGLVQGQLGQFGANVGRQVRDNPLPLLLIGAGIGMLVLANRKPQAEANIADHELQAEQQYRKLEGARASLKRNADETEDAFHHRMHQLHAAALDLQQHAGEAVDVFKARVAGAASAIERTALGVRDRLGAGYDKAATFVGDQARHLGEGAANARDQAGALYNDNPLAAGAIGVALGAIIGALTPLSSVEREGLHDVADKAGKVGADLAERGAKAVEKVADKLVH